MIEIKCKAADTLAIDELLEFQGTLKKLSKDNAKKLRRSIEQNGFIAPFFVWDDGGRYRLIDGHQRLAVLLQMRKDGEDIPLLPVDYIQADSEEDAKRKLLYITSQYGEFTTEGFEEFTLDLTGFDDIRLTDGEFDLTLVDNYDFSEFEEDYESMDGMNDCSITITVPQKHKEKVEDFLCQGNSKTSPGFGLGVLKLCGLL